MNPIIQLVRSIIDPEGAGQTPSEVVHEEMPKMREALERLPPHRILSLPTSPEEDGRRLV